LELVARNFWIFSRWCFEKEGAVVRGQEKKRLLPIVIPELLA